MVSRRLLGSERHSYLTAGKTCFLVELHPMSPIFMFRMGFNKNRSIPRGDCSFWTMVQSIHGLVESLILSFLVSVFTPLPSSHFPLFFLLFLSLS